MPNTIKTSADKIVEKHMNKIYNRVPSLQSENFKLCIRMAATDCAILEVEACIDSIRKTRIEFNPVANDELHKLELLKQELKSRIV